MVNRLILATVLVGVCLSAQTYKLHRRMPAKGTVAGGGNPAPTVVSWSKASVHIPTTLCSVLITNSGNNRIQIAHTGTGDSDLNGSAIISITNHAGTAFTRMWTNNGSAWPRAEMWYLINPPTGTNTIYATVDANIDDLGMTVFCVQDAAQTSSFGTPAVAAAAGNITVTVTSAVGELVVGGVASDDESTLVISGGTNPAGVGVINGDTAFAAGYWTGAASVGANWNAAVDTTGGGVSIKPVP